MQLQFDPVDRPEHYNRHPSGVECIDIVRHFSYNKGCAIKYIWRASYKGEEIQDLEKAIKSLKNEINRLTMEVVENA